MGWTVFYVDPCLVEDMADWVADATGRSVSLGEIRRLARTIKQQASFQGNWLARSKDSELTSTRPM